MIKICFCVVSLSLLFNVLGACRNTPEEINILYQQYELLPKPSIIHQWKIKETDALDCLKELPDSIKPRLPQGFIWSIDTKGKLCILKHRCAEVVNFNIYLFGPDNNKRVQFLVIENDMPIHGFAMTRIGKKFPDTLRGTYPMSDENYKKGSKTQCRGHIIDYACTLGSDLDSSVSTLCCFNYKPEPWGYWSRTLRAWLVGNLRNTQGSYSEFIFYSFKPEETNNKTPIPDGVIFEGFSPTFFSCENYLVDWKHECHDWTKRDHTCESAADILKSAKKVRPIVWDRQVTIVNQKINLDQFFKRHNDIIMDFVDSYHLMIAAEAEYEGAILKMAYLTWTITQNASLSIVKFWLSRSALMSKYIDDVYSSAVPAFFVSQLSDIKRALNARGILEEVGIYESFLVLEAVYDHMMDGRLSLYGLFDKEEHPDLTFSETTPEKSLIVDCNYSPKSIKSITPKIETAVLEGGSFYITGIRSAQGARSLSAVFDSIQEKYPNKPILLKNYDGSTRYKKAINNILSRHLYSSHTTINLSTIQVNHLQKDLLVNDTIIPHNIPRIQEKISGPMSINNSSIHNTYSLLEIGFTNHNFQKLLEILEKKGYPPTEIASMAGYSSNYSRSLLQMKDTEKHPRINRREKWENIVKCLQERGERY